ncbi:hypothetical protein IQ06DRAFT_297402 [Phaeosphaeriaceae sp. SRC1lsM3a]|nr:hypothetical protein IQ06DRAFT_297402 [Stagonospora sp. SRC1lsM3a]
MRRMRRRLDCLLLCSGAGDFRKGRENVSSHMHTRRPTVAPASHQSQLALSSRCDRSRFRSSRKEFSLIVKSAIGSNARNSGKVICALAGFACHIPGEYRRR